MATITKPKNQAFVLDKNKSEKFLEQNNDQFRSIMAKFEKFTSPKSRSSSKKNNA